MFRVEWLQAARDGLARLWLQADSALRQAITAAAHTIDEQLQDDPLGVGESRTGNDRVLFVPPLGIRYEVDSTNNFVLKPAFDKPNARPPAPEKSSTTEKFVALALCTVKPY